MLPYLAVVGVVAMAACLYLTRTAPGLAPDSVVYLGTAHNLSTGRGLTTPFNLMFNPYPPARAVSFGGDFPLTQYPPLFPIVLGALGWLGAGLVGAARAVNAGLFGVNVVLIGLLVARITRSRLLAVLGALAFAMSANVLINHGLVMSEPLMLTALLAGILTLPWLFRDPASRVVAGGRRVRRRGVAHPPRRRVLHPRRHPRGVALDAALVGDARALRRRGGRVGRRAGRALGGDHAHRVAVG